MYQVWVSVSIHAAGLHVYPITYYDMHKVCES